MPSRLKGHHFPRTVIGYAVWAYHRVALGLRDVEDLLAERGGRRLSRDDPDLGRRDRPDPADTWHRDEVVLRINGVRR